MDIITRFCEFFAAANDDAWPYPWQRALVEEVAETGLWPDIAAPTGAGKSSVVDIHVFLVAGHKLDYIKARPPRRLVLVAPRRVLVDDQYERARCLARLLGDAEPTSPLREVAEALKAMCASDVTSDSAPPSPLGASPLGVWRLRGGVRLDSGWRLEPAACQIVCCTPQMWGSRLLLRGYSASRRSRNLESGLLSHDTVAVIDEAHLHERLRETARRIAGRQSGTAALQVVSMTATPGSSDQRQISLTGADERDDALSRRIHAVKRIELIEVRDARRDIEGELISAARSAAGRGTVGVFINDVPTAVAVAAALQRDDATVALVCGRMRPADLERLRADRPQLLTPRGDDSVDFLVSTQSLEVGVDLDLSAMVSMLAPPSALAQRAGRLNRSGRWGETTLVVVAPGDLRDADPAEAARSGPYVVADLVTGLRWLESLMQSISPWDVMRVSPPTPPRPPLPALRQVDLHTLELTSDRQTGDPDLELYLADPGTDLDQIGIAARGHLRLEDEVVADILRACPPRAHEVASHPILGERERERILQAAAGDVWRVHSEDGDLEVERFEKGQRLMPGDVLVVPDGTPLCIRGIVDLSAARRAAEALDDVLDRVPEGAARDAIVELEAVAIARALALDPTLGSRAARNELADVLVEAGHVERGDRMRSHPRLSELELHWSGGAEAPRGLLLIRDMRSRAAEVPVFSADKIVTLEHHQRDVVGRLGDILGRLGAVVSDRERQALLLAARCHDEGKRHPRFQSRMGAAAGEPEPVAKPLPRHRPDQGDGWRHEQLSAAFAALLSDRDPLVVALVATHHGGGRGLFDRGADELLAGWDDCDPRIVEEARVLFGRGGSYERLGIEARREVGLFRLAWLQALLRCADMQISREGK